MIKFPLKSVENIQFMNECDFDMRECPVICDDLKIRKDHFNDIYYVEEDIGRGKFAVVRRCRNKENSSLVAAKFQRKRRKGKDCRHEILSEIRMLKKGLLHPNLVNLIEVYESANEIIIVTDFASGGELFQTIISEEKISERIARCYIEQTLEGLSFLHDQHIVHLDVKPQNILLTKPFPYGDIKLCDFGFARTVKSGDDVRDIIGTPDFVAPEILSYEPIQIKSDMWSVGVLAYVLLTGYSPFQGDSKQETFLNISQVNLDFPEDLFENISTEAQDFMESLLVREPEKRLSSHCALKHPWFYCDLENSDDIVPSPQSSKTYQESFVSMENKFDDPFSNINGEEILSVAPNNFCCREEKANKRVSMSLVLHDERANFVSPINRVKYDIVLQQPQKINNSVNLNNIEKTTNGFITTPSKITLFSDCNSPGGKFLPSLKNRDIDSKVNNS